jgi:stress response protein YsnF
MNTTRGNANLHSDTPVSTGIPFWDMMLSFGKASQQALSGYAPQAGYAPRPQYGTWSDRGAVQHTTNKVEVIPVGEETLNVGTRLVSGETTRVRRIVVETPVEQGVSLREERVVVERRKPTAASGSTTQGILTDAAFEMSDSYEVADVWKSVRVTEEVVLRREVTERHETVRDTVRRDEVVVEQAKRSVPALPQASKSEPAHLAADLEKAAERFETNAAQQEKALATLHETLDAEANATKAEQKPTASQPQVQALKANAEQNDKNSNSRKG